MYLVYLYPVLESLQFVTAPCGAINTSTWIHLYLPLDGQSQNHFVDILIYFGMIRHYTLHKASKGSDSQTIIHHPAFLAMKTSKTNFEWMYCIEIPKRAQCLT